VPCFKHRLLPAAAYPIDLPLSMCDVCLQWGRDKWQAAGAIFAVGKAVLTLHPPLRPLGHNANPRDGAQDITM
jgi:hypothetical protein